jgi:hypothetical protein
LVGYVNWPKYFAEYGLKEPKSVNYNPHTVAWGHPEWNFWEIIYENPQRVKDFAQCMNTIDQLLPITGYYDFTWIADTAAADKERILFVDVGGGKGQAIKIITKENPGIDRARCVLQDLPEVIKEVKSLDAPELQGAQTMAHDFYEEQPVKGAACYYIRRVLHDYSDENCAEILRNVANAATSDSRILITEQIMNNPPNPLSAQTDLCMLSIGGKERTAKNFHDLAAASGLKVQGIHQAKGTSVGVIECVKA